MLHTTVVNGVKISVYDDIYEVGGEVCYDTESFIEKTKNLRSFIIEDDGKWVIVNKGSASYFSSNMEALKCLLAIGIKKKSTTVVNGTTIDEYPDFYAVDGEYYCKMNFVERTKKLGPFIVPCSSKWFAVNNGNSKEFVTKKGAQNFVNKKNPLSVTVVNGVKINEYKDCYKVNGNVVLLGDLAKKLGPFVIQCDNLWVVADTNSDSKFKTKEDAEKHLLKITEDTAINELVKERPLSVTIVKGVRIEEFEYDYMVGDSEVNLCDLAMEVGPFVVPCNNEWKAVTSEWDNNFPTKEEALKYISNFGTKEANVELSPMPIMEIIQPVTDPVLSTTIVNGVEITDTIEVSKKEEESMNRVKQGIVSEALRNGTSAGYRIASKKAVQTLRAAVLKVLSLKMDVTLAEAFLTTEAGEGLLALILGITVPTKDNVYMEEITKELRVAGMLGVGNGIIGAIFEELVPVVNEIVECASVGEIEETEAVSHRSRAG